MASIEQISEYLQELLEVQDELVSLLDEKRPGASTGEKAATSADQATDHQNREAELMQRLEACRERRGQILAAEASAGVKPGNLRELVASLDSQEQEPLLPLLNSAQEKGRLVSHKTVAQWVAMQRSLTHVSQLLEILATGGEQKPTYGEEGPAGGGGGLVDQAA